MGGENGASVNRNAIGTRQVKRTSPVEDRSRRDKKMARRAGRSMRKERG
ncbi:hypothetical protein P3T43_006997 [Paraburkholderia sp. GAS41]